MPDQDISPNKIGDREERRADHLKDKFEDQGMGRDEAAKRALAQATGESTNHGGTHTAGEPKKETNPESTQRRGSDKEAK